MRISMLVLMLLVVGCSSGVYKVSPDEYQQQVKTLGILPLLVDGRSVIEHPDAAGIFALLRRAAQGQGPALVETLRSKKGYFDVRLIAEPPRLLADKLLLKGQADDSGQPLGHQLALPFLAELCRDSVVDGLLLISIQSVVHKQKRWSRNTFENLTTDYNDIMITASVVAADGRVLWEMSGTESATILSLQYPDFDEAHFNKTDAVTLKFIGLAGLERTLLPATTATGDRPQSPQIGDWLDRVTAALSPSLFR